MTGAVTATKSTSRAATMMCFGSGARRGSPERKSRRALAQARPLDAGRFVCYDCDGPACHDHSVDSNRRAVRKGPAAAVVPSAELLLGVRDQAPATQLQITRPGADHVVADLAGFARATA